MRTETFFEQITDASVGNLEGLSPEGFWCSPGNILVVVPPEKEVSDGGISIPEVAREKSCVGRVASVPKDDDLCPVQPGCWVVFRQYAGMPVPFGKRKDLLLLQYELGPASEILGWFSSEDLTLDGTDKVS